MDNLNDFELNAVLFYADFLSLKNSGITVTDNCKYHFVYKSPFNSAYVIDSEPFYDTENKYYKDSVSEYMTIKNKFGEDGVESFISNICNIGVSGCVSAKDMLKYIHLYSTRKERNKAYNKYITYRDNISYTHIEYDDEGKEVRRPCSSYVAHYEKAKNINNPQICYGKS